MPYCITYRLVAGRAIGFFASRCSRKVLGVFTVGYVANGGPMALLMKDFYRTLLYQVIGKPS